MSSENKVYFVTGANRGIGFAIVQELSTRANTTVIGTARAPELATDLQNWGKDHRNVHILKYDASNPEALDELVKHVDKISSGIDVLIANAATEESSGTTVIDTSKDVWTKHYNVNVLGPILLLQCLFPSLNKKATKQVVFISSEAGSIGKFVPVTVSAYGQSKAALNYSTRELAVELGSKGFTIIALHPGVVTTDMAKTAMNRVDPEAREFIKNLAIDVETSAKQQLKVIDGLSSEDNGKFLSYTGAESTW
jgi:NAD(P)-dependent dehydrogenase (short-subunit alcohol dehydrogenase family)